MRWKITRRFLPLMRPDQRWIGAALLGIICLLTQMPAAVQVDSAPPDLTRTYSARIAFPPDPSKAEHTQAVFVALQNFFETVQFYQAVNYSLIHNVGPGNARLSDADLCSAATLLDNVVRNAVFRDGDQVEKAVFQSLGLVESAVPDSYCRVQITLDPAGKRTIDYVWRLNPNYDGPPPHFTLQIGANSALLTLTYGDKAAALNGGYLQSPEGASAFLSDQFTAIMKGRKVGVALIPLAGLHSIAEAGYNADDQLPVASAFKGPVAIYFFENVNSVVWRSVPIRYWNATHIDSVPDDYQAAWTQYHVILKNVYEMAVHSDNDATGKTLAYVYENSAWQTRATNPLIAFNDWSRQNVGISKLSGLHSWFAGTTACVGCTDERFINRPLVYAGKILYINNTYSPRDLARFYIYLATRGRALGYYDTAIELLSNQPTSLIKEYTAFLRIRVASKDGYVAPNSAYGNGYRNQHRRRADHAAGWRTIRRGVYGLRRR